MTLVRIVWFGLPLLLAACADGRDARPNAERIAAAAGLRRVEIPADPFRLVGYVRFGGAPVLRVYIEGDGHAWARRDLPSDDPTPWSPVALELAARDSAASVAYLGRPCQYVAPGSDPACQVNDWTDGRYAEPVITGTSRAIDRLVVAGGARGVELIGFSGGGAVAALVAARRHDIVNLRTVAANLDTAAWTSRQGLRPLTGSLDPADAWARLASVPQAHFSGAADSVVASPVLRAYLARFSDQSCIVATVVPGVGHTEGWPAIWPDLLRQPVRCEVRR